MVFRFGCELVFTGSRSVLCISILIRIITYWIVVFVIHRLVSLSSQFYWFYFISFLKKEEDLLVIEKKKLYQNSSSGMYLPSESSV